MAYRRVFKRRRLLRPKRRFRRAMRRSYGRVRTRRGLRPKFLFHRYCVAIPTANFNISGGTYNSLGSSVLSINSGVQEMSFSSFFTLADLPNVSEFVNLFDLYKINCVVVTLKLTNDPSATSPPNTNTANYGNYYPTVWYSPDHDDITAQTVSQLKEYEKVKHRVLRPNQELSIKLRPTTLGQQYRTAVTTGYVANYRKEWLDMSQTDIPHYGLKLAIDCEGITTAVVAASQLPQVKVNVKYYISCKNTR